MISRRTFLRRAALAAAAVAAAPVLPALTTPAPTLTPVQLLPLDTISTELASDGGFLVPKEIAADIEHLLRHATVNGRCRGSRTERPCV